MTKRMTAAGAVGAMVLSGAVLAGTSSAQATSGRQLAGTWAVSVDPDAPGMPSFTSTILYTSTGGLVETTMNRPPSMISTGLGRWERLGEGRFAVTHRKYRWEDDTFVGTVLVQETGSVSPNGTRYDARATTTLLDPQQRVVRSFTSTVTAERL